MCVGIRRGRPSPSVLVRSALASAVIAGWCGVAAPARAVTSPCTDESTPTLNSTVTCSTPGNIKLAVPNGTSTVDLEVQGAGGGGGYPSGSHHGGDAAQITGTATLPANTAFLTVIVGAGGSGDQSGAGGGGGGGSAVLALGTPGTACSASS